MVRFSKEVVFVDITVDKEYINVDDALKRIGGNMGLYKKLLGRFLESNHFDALDSAIATGNMEEASHMAHTIKGVCSNLSLVKITAISTELEQCIKAGQDPGACFDELKQAYTTTIDMVKEIISA